VAESRRERRRLRRGPLVLLAVVAAALVAAALTGCGTSGGGSSASSDPLVGYWVGGGKGSQMTLVQIQKNGETYKVLANPDVPAGDAKKEGDTLVVDTHVVKLTFSPQAADKLALEFTGDMFKKPVTVNLSRTDQNGYADAATAYGLVAIRRGLGMWKAGGGKKYPPPSEVTPSGMLAKMIHWPTNMFTGQPMQPGTGKGDYTYTQVDGGKSYSLVAHLSDGSSIGK
jgi:hypothetical protein